MPKRRTRRRMTLGRPIQGPRRYGSGGRSYTIRVPGNPYSKSLRNANAANEARYQQLLSGYRALGKRAEGYLEGQGDSAKQDIEETFRNASSNTYNTLVNRGFANSSLMSTMQQGNMRNMSREKSRVDEQVARQKLEADMAISDRIGRVIENRTDAGPDVQQGIALAQGLGQYGGGGGGYGGGGYGPMPPYGFNPQLAMMQQQWLAQNRGPQKLMPRSRLGAIKRRKRVLADRSAQRSRNLLKAGILNASIIDPWRVA